MSSSVTSCFKCQIDFGCKTTLEFHQLMFHFESDDKLKSHVYLNLLLKETSYRDVGEQVPSSEQNPCEELQNKIDDFDWTRFNELPSTELDCVLESFIDFDLPLIEHQDVQDDMGEQILTNEPYLCEKLQNEINDFDWTTFNEVLNAETDSQFESYMGLDPQLTINQDVQEDVGEQILTTEPYPSEESQNEIDDFDWTTFNEVPSIEADGELESFMDFDLPIIEHQDLQVDLGEQILTTEPYLCEELQTKSDDYHQTSSIKVSRTEVSRDQEQNKYHKTVQKNVRTKKKDLECNVCQKTFSQQSNLKKHIKTVHDKQKDYECDVCKKKFSEKGSLKVHKKVIHDKQEDHKCDLCQKTFANQGHLKIHVKTVHDKQKDFECDVCQKTFSLQSNLKKHIKTVHDKQKDFECDLCQKRFKHKASLKIHKKAIHDKQKDYECDLCQKKFSVENNLKAHQRSVHEGRRYECELCESIYSCQSYLRRHQKAVHKE